MSKQINLSTGSLATVKFRCDIIDSKTGRLVKRGKEQKNLLFDAGLDRVATMHWPSLFAYFVLGTGTTPTRRDSGTITFSRSGTTITASANFFEAGDSGRLLKFDSGEECYLTFIDGTTATFNISGTVAASEGTIYYVNRTSLGAEVKRTNTLTTDTGDHGSSWNGTTGILSTWKTMLFSAETTTETYKEIGWSHASSGTNLISGAELIAGGGDTLVADQQYKVRLQLDRVVTPRTDRALAASDVVDLWTGTAAEITEFVSLSVWATNGTLAVSGGMSEAILEPSLASRFDLSTSSAALRATALGVPTSPSGGTSVFGSNGVNDDYATGSFFRDSYLVITPAQANSTSIRSIMVVPYQTAGVHRVLFDEAQTKTSSQKLTIRFRKSWGRVLTN